MNAVIVTDTEKLVWQDVPDPVPGPGEVRVEVVAAGINRADLSQRAGKYPPPPGASEFLGLELAGRIAELGAGVTGWQLGDRVCALLTGGGYAEQAVVPAGMLMPLPERYGFEQAAGIPEVFLTAFLNLFLEADLKAGERALIHGGASGIGTAAIQLVRAAGCRALVTAGTDEKVALCRELGAELALNYRAQDFVEAVQAYVGENGVDVILDMVGAEYLARNLALLSRGGRMVFIATLSGRRAELDIGTLMGKHLMLKGSTLRSRPLAEKVRIKEAFMRQFWEAIEAGEIRPVIDRVFRVQDAEAAHQYMRENKTLGKLILRVQEGD